METIKLCFVLFNKVSTVRVPAAEAAHGVVASEDGWGPELRLEVPRMQERCTLILLCETLSRLLGSILFVACATSAFQEIAVEMLLV